MRQFLADASHELRTPLTSIRGYAELARMQRAVGDDGRRQPRPHRVRGHPHVAAGRGPAACWPAATPTARAARSARADRRRRPRRRRGQRARGPRSPTRQIDMDVAGDPHVIGDRDQLLRVCATWSPTPPCTPTPGRPIRGARGRRRPRRRRSRSSTAGPGLPPERGRARVRAVLARRQGPHPGPRRQRVWGCRSSRRSSRRTAARCASTARVESGSTVTVWLPAAHAAVD